MLSNIQIKVIKERDAQRNREGFHCSSEEGIPPPLLPLQTSSVYVCLFVCTCVKSGGLGMLAERLVWAYC